MSSLYIIGETKPETEDSIHNIESQIPFPIPVDYSEFLCRYGFGTINELLMINPPDKDFLQLNFGNDMDLWDLTETEVNALLEGITIGKTIDGDIITINRESERPVTILPRHSNKPLKLECLKAVIEHYNKQYDFSNNLYFDPFYNFEQEYISFIINGKLETDLFGNVYKAFLNNITYDKVYNTEVQPKYIIQNIGGWLYFDNIGKSAIRVKYQTQFKAKADKILEFIKTLMN